MGRKMQHKKKLFELMNPFVGKRQIRKTAKLNAVRKVEI
jgi:hypothetical protein